MYLTADKIYIFNVGDSRTILSKNGDFVFATKDHKPDDPVEQERILKNPYCYVSNRMFDVPRVNGVLALSRALGDFHLKKIGTVIPRHEQPVIANPDVSIFDRKDASHILMASDGVFDVLSNDQICALMTGGSEKIVENAISRRSADNMTVLIVDLSAD